MKEEFIDQNKLSKFDTICLFLMSTFKEKDLIEDIKNNNNRFDHWGEIERFSRFGIDFTKMKWFQDIATSWCPEKLEKLTYDFAEAGFKLHQYLEEKDLNNNFME